MISRIVNMYCELPTWARRPLWKIVHWYFNTKDEKNLLSFMNYGYASLDSNAERLELDEKDEGYRYSIQLYHHVVSAIDLKGREVLEVGCGRGGGAYYVSRYLKPMCYIGLDQSVGTAEYSNQAYQVDGLSFIHGDAEKLPIPDNSFDAVVNVESSRCYRNMDRFLSEVLRILRPGGHFLFADMRLAGHEDLLKEQFENAGLKILEEEEITPNVVKALDLDHERRHGWISDHAPAYFKKGLRAFAGVKGSVRYRTFADRSMLYWRFLLQKPVE